MFIYTNSQTHFINKKRFTTFNFQVCFFKPRAI